MLAVLMLVSSMTSCGLGKDESSAESSKPAVIDNRDKDEVTSQTPSSSLSKKEEDKDNQKESSGKNASSSKQDGNKDKDTSKKQEENNNAEVPPVKTEDDYTFQPAPDTSVGDAQDKPNEPKGEAELGEDELIEETEREPVSVKNDTVKTANLSVKPSRPVKSAVNKKEQKVQLKLSPIALGKNSFVIDNPQAIRRNPLTAKKGIENQSLLLRQGENEVSLTIQQLAATSVEKIRTTAGLNLRKDPSTKNPRIGFVDQGTVLTVLGISDDGAWYQVQTPGGQKGYVTAEYVQDVNGGSSTNGTSVKSVKTTAGLNLRKDPSTKNPRIGFVEQGSVLTVLGISSDNNWYKVKTPGGQEGYVSAQYVQNVSGNSNNNSTVDTDVKSIRTTAGLNLRRDPSTRNPRIGFVEQGTVLTVLGMSADKAWYKVKTSGGQEGFVSAQYVQSVSNNSGNSNQTVDTDVKSVKATAGLNLRKDPSTKQARIGFVDEGSVLTVLGMSADKGWYKVKTAGGQEGYVSAQYVQEVKSGNSNTGSQVNKTDVKKVKTTAGLNLRKDPSTKYARIGFVDQNTTVTVLGISNDKGWYKIKTAGGQEGFISAQYTKIVESGTNQPDDNKDSETTIKKVKTTAGLNLRKDPSTKHARIGFVDQNTVLTVLAISKDKKWYKVKTSNGLEGYISAEYAKVVEDGNIKDEDKDTNTDIKKVKATAVINLRKGPSTQNARITLIDKGTVLTVLGLSADKKWYKVKTPDGKEGYVSAEYAEEVKTTPANGKGWISASKASINQYRTLYVTGDIGGSTDGITWVSDNPEIASVKSMEGDKGRALIYAKTSGTTSIHLKSESDNKIYATLPITVIQAEAARFTYADVNTPSVGQAFNLVAVTDTSKTAVKFDVTTPNGTTVSYEVAGPARTETEGENTVAVFEKSVSFDEVGAYTIAVSTKTSGADWRKSNISNTFSVVSTQDQVTTSDDVRAASSHIIDFIAKREGAASQAYVDTIGTGKPVTVGFGILVGKNKTFYNDLTPTELKASLVETINKGGYASAVEKYRSNNQIAMNQQQFDALVSFVYNLGTGVLNTGYDTFVVINNAKQFTGQTTGELNLMNMPLYQEANRNSKKLATVNKGEKVTVMDSAVSKIQLSKADSSVSVDERWYKVTYNGQTGWMQAGGVNIDGKINLAYVDEQMVGSNFLQWNIAGGNHIVGLLKRRLAEAKIFCYGAYQASYDNAFNPGFDIPSGFSYSVNGEVGGWKLS